MFRAPGLKILGRLGTYFFYFFFFYFIFFFWGGGGDIILCILKGITLNTGIFSFGLTTNPADDEPYINMFLFSAQSGTEYMSVEYQALFASKKLFAVCCKLQDESVTYKTHLPV